MAMPASTPDETFLALPAPRERIAMASAFRSTWLGSSVLALRSRGLFDRYLEHLPRTYHEPILSSVAGMWLPIEVALEHYRACDQLGLVRQEMWEIGLDVTRRVHGTTLNMAIRLAKQAGVTPWTIFAQLNRLWERIWVGGGVTVHRRGPKEAIVEVVQWPCASIPYVRTSMPAVVHGLTELFCAKAYAHEVAKMTSDTSMAVRVQWA